MDIATASLLDEGTAAAEAMAMFHRLQAKKVGAGRESVFLVGKGCYPQTLDVLRGRAEPLDITLEIVRSRRSCPTRRCRVRSACCCSIRTTAAALSISAGDRRARTRRACWSRSRRISWR